MFTDIVGYSTLINKDQDLALELLEKHNQILMPAIENNNGLINKYISNTYPTELPKPFLDAGSPLPLPPQNHGLCGQAKNRTPFPRPTFASTPPA